MYGKTIECGGMICEREMSLAGDGKQLKKVMTECPMVDREFQRTEAATGNERRPTVDRRKDGTRSDCEDDDRSRRRPGKSATRVS